MASASAVDVPNGLSQRTALPASSAAVTHCGMEERGSVHRDEVDVGVFAQRAHRVGVAR